MSSPDYSTANILFSNFYLWTQVHQSNLLFLTTPFCLTIFPSTCLVLLFFFPVFLMLAIFLLLTNRVVAVFVLQSLGAHTRRFFLHVHAFQSHFVFTIPGWSFSKRFWFGSFSIS